MAPDMLIIGGVIAVGLYLTNTLCKTIPLNLCFSGFGGKDSGQTPAALYPIIGGGGLNAAGGVNPSKVVKPADFQAPMAFGYAAHITVA